MLNLAICDDNFDFLEIVLLYIQHYFNDKKNVNIKTFSNGKDLIAYCKKEPYAFDMILLDIDMPELDGIETAKGIRTLNTQVLLVFLTGLEDKVFETFKLNTFRYIRKHKIQEELKECLLSCIKKLTEDEYYTFKTEEGWERVPINDILYFDYAGRCVEIHTLQSVYKTKIRRMKDIEEAFENKGFVRLHRSCVAQLKYIKSIRGQQIILDQEEKLMISRYRLKEVLESYRSYIN